ncbi:hypothetical protein [Streptomyces sp. UNOC14_S4]|uniref:hypothetical protein n=1 Tax=Streptomyces sp. UNOC14_S4 TaxID=2872340 RepID=UPI001E375C8B|nr:hypothetical protein [Streptomyces sp. UNOC14_S4]MCC3767594.1 hypothetical protein [Streptomyces sp. UNOC14_S4]
MAVTTFAPESRSARAEPPAALIAAVELEEERRAAVEDVQHPVTSGPFRFSEIRVCCDSTLATAVLGRRGVLWGLVLDLDDQRLVAVGSGIEPESVGMGQVKDLRVFLQGRRALQEHTTERVRQATALHPRPVAHGDALRALAMRYGTGGLDSEPRSDLWAAAVDELGARGTSAEEARQLATSVVNHVAHLLHHVPWFSADAAPREAAIDETVHFATRHVDVPSQAAQRAWDQYWHAHQNRSGTSPQARRAELDHLVDVLLPRWIRAWNTWYERR